MSAVFILCILVAFSVWTVNGKNQQPQPEDTGIPEADVCLACKKALNYVKENTGQNPSESKLKTTLGRACSSEGKLFQTCKDFVKQHRQALLRDLQTTDNVTKICVKEGACNGVSKNRHF
ncbi:uncharacterized protein KZ484_012306 isoform 2-T2 [Pholidichthys leucotaenia]